MKPGIALVTGILGFMFWNLGRAPDIPEVVHERLPRSTPAMSPADGAGDYRWTLPDGWRALAGTGFRLATLMASDGERRHEVTVTMFGGDAGGLASNVNRWREQVGLPPLSVEEAEASLELVEGTTGTLCVSRLDGEIQSIRAAIIPGEGATVFVKLSATRDVAQRLDEALVNFATTVRRAAR